MRRMLEIIVQEQAPYLLGNEPHPRPLKRVQLALQLGVHESTVSRAVGNKTIALPAGRIVPLAYFFDQSLAARAVVQAMIDGESQPLSDHQIAERLAEQGLQVARRTVSKYRTMNGISASNRRA
jgi:RNA polymerase sigma-54 factor